MRGWQSSLTGNRYRNGRRFLEKMEMLNEMWYNICGLVATNYQATQPREVRAGLAADDKYYPYSGPLRHRRRGVFVSQAYYIYGLREVGTDEIRYIGHTNGPRERFWCHKRADNRHYTEGNKPLGRWLQAVGDGVELVILEETTQELARAREELQIRTYRQSGHRLLNKRAAAQHALTAEEKHAATFQGDSTLKTALFVHMFYICTVILKGKGL